MMTEVLVLTIYFITTAHSLIAAWFVSVTYSNPIFLKRVVVSLGAFLLAIIPIINIIFALVVLIRYTNRCIEGDSPW